MEQTWEASQLTGTFIAFSVPRCDRILLPAFDPRFPVLDPMKSSLPFGAGGMGEVYREAQVLASLNHPNITQIYGIEESGCGKWMRCDPRIFDPQITQIAQIPETTYNKMT
jgi:hypothetical protein